MFDQVINLSNDEIKLLISLLRNHPDYDTWKTEINLIVKSLDESRPVPDVEKEVELRNEIVDGLTDKCRKLLIKCVRLKQENESLKTQIGHYETAIRELFYGGKWQPTDFGIRKCEGLWKSIKEKETKEKESAS